MSDLPAVIEQQRSTFLAVLSDKAINFDREASFALQILGANDYLGKTALSNPNSLASAINNVAAIGITLNPAAKLAYLLPRKIGGQPAICLAISYMGLLQIAQQCGAILWGQALLVHEKDKFTPQAPGQQPIHEYNPFSDRGAVIGVYCVVKTAEGDFLTHTMKLSEVYAIRDRSDAWKAYKRDSTKTCPWVTDEGEMIKKTCIKQAAKTWPRRDNDKQRVRLEQAIEHMNNEGGEGITLKPNTMPDDEFGEWKDKILATETTDQAKEVWRKSVKVCEELGDVETAKKLKAVLIQHGQVLADAQKEVV